MGFALFRRGKRAKDQSVISWLLPSGGCEVSGDPMRRTSAYNFNNNWLHGAPQVIFERFFLGFRRPVQLVMMIFGKDSDENTNRNVIKRRDWAQISGAIH